MVRMRKELIMARHIVMDSSGHSTFEFDPASLADLNEAELRFNRLVEKGYVPAELTGDGTHLVQPPNKRSFNPSIDETIFVPAIRGG
jgi:hypothetical protein